MFLAIAGNDIGKQREVINAQPYVIRGYVELDRARFDAIQGGNRRVSPRCRLPAQRNTVGAEHPFVEHPDSSPLQQLERVNPGLSLGFDQLWLGQVKGQR